MVGKEPAGVAPAFVLRLYLGQPVVYPHNPPANPPLGDCSLNRFKLFLKCYLSITLFGFSEEIRMTLPVRQVQAFLIHTHINKKVVHALYSRLAKDDINPWLDAERLMPGQDWQHEIRRAILMSDIVIVCLSKHFIQHQGFCQEELKIALEKANMIPAGEMFIIPVRLEECDIPGSLARWHCVDLFKAGGYRKLVRSLRRYVELA